MYMPASCKHKYFVFQYEYCWAAVDFTTACTVHVRMYCRYFSLPKFHSTQRSALSESHISLWSSIALQQSENRVAAQPLIWIKCHTLIQFNVKLAWQTCHTSCQHAALRAAGRKTESRKFSYQPIDLGMWHSMSFSFSTGTLDLS